MSLKQEFLQIPQEVVDEIRAMNSPFARNLRGLVRAVREFQEEGSKVGKNRLTRAIIHYAEELEDIDRGILEDRNDALGYPVEEEKS